MITGKLMSEKHKINNNTHTYMYKIYTQVWFYFYSLPNIRLNKQYDIKNEANYARDDDVCCTDCTS